MPASDTPQWKIRRAAMFFKDDKQTKDIAKALNISKRTVRRWRNEWKNNRDSFYNSFESNEALTEPTLGAVQNYDS